MRERTVGDRRTMHHETSKTGEATDQASLLEK